MNFLILTGISGGGKSNAIAMLEDIGYFCVDNIPPGLLGKFSELANTSTVSAKGIAVVVDTRSGDMFGDFEDELDKLKNKNIDFKLLFIDATDEVILKRYKETRRKHPLADDVCTLDMSIAYEREQLENLKKKADYLIDTTNLSVAQLKQKLFGFFGGENEKSIIVNCVSFGFKYGIPLDVDLQYDVRCLVNPFYVPELRYKTGLEKEVVDYIMENKSSVIFLEKIIDFLDFAMPLYIAEGKSQLTIGIGCTGGKHRSVAFTEKIGKYLSEKGYGVIITHRDIEKNKR